MAVISFTFGSMLGSILGLFAWLVLGWTVAMSFGLYLMAGLILGGIPVVMHTLHATSPARGGSLPT